MSEILESERPSSDSIPATPVAGGGESPSLAERLTQHGWWGVVWFVSGLVLGAGPLGDNSFLTHLATGRLILDRGFPHADPYSYTAPGSEWVVQSWGASTLYASIEEVVGAWGIRMLVGVLTGLLLAMLWRLTRPAGGLVGRLLLMTLAAGMQFAGWSERPQLIALVLLAATTIVVLDRRSPAWLAVVFAVWVNVHGSFPVGLLAVGLLAVPLVVERRVTWRDALTNVAAATFGAVAGALVSPYGADLLVFPVRMLGRSEVLRYINEWRRPELSEPTTWFGVVFAVIAVASVCRRRAWAWMPIVVVFAGLAATSNRNLALASVVLVPAAAPGLVGLGTIPSVAPVAWRRALAVGAVATVVVGTFTASTPDYDLGRYPLRALEWMDEQNLQPTAERHVVTHDFVGNFLEWRDGPRNAVFLDDRAELFGEQIVADYVSLMNDADHFDELGWRSVLDRYDADVVLFSAKAVPFAAALEASGEWEMGYRDEGWFVACRRTAGLDC